MTIDYEGINKCCVCGKNTSFVSFTFRGYLCKECLNEWNEKGFESSFMKGVAYETESDSGRPQRHQHN